MEASQKSEKLKSEPKDKEKKSKKDLDDNKDKKEKKSKKSDSKPSADKEKAKAELLLKANQFRESKSDFLDVVKCEEIVVPNEISKKKIRVIVSE